MVALDQDTDFMVCWRGPMSFPMILWLVFIYHFDEGIQKILFLFGLRNYCHC